LNILSLCSSLNVRDHVSHPHWTTGKIIVLHIPFFNFLDSRREDKWPRTDWWQLFINLIALYNSTQIRANFSSDTARRHRNSYILFFTCFTYNSD
jgi:hypothetical protein